MPPEEKNSNNNKTVTPTGSPCQTALQADPENLPLSKPASPTPTTLMVATTEKQRRDSEDSDDSIDSFENYIPTPPDGGWGWVIVAVSLVNNIIVDGIGYSFGVFLSEFTDYFKEAKSKVSLVGSLLCGVYLFAGPLVSAFTNKFGCRPVAIAGSIIAAISFILSIWAPSVDILIVTYGVMAGFGLGMVYLPSIVSVGYYFEKKRALATGIAVCGSGIGTFIFAPLSDFLLEELDWKSALLIIAGITLQGVVCGALMRPLEPTKRVRRPRAKNLLDRIKEQAKGNRNRTVSETSGRFSGRDTNSILERVMAAKLQRERRLQEDDSELGSLPSICFMKQQLRKDSAARDSRIHKLSFSDRGDLTSYMGSPMGSVPRIVVHDGIAETEAETSLTPDESLQKASEFERGNLVKASREAAATSSSGQEETELTRISADEVTSTTGDDLFVDAESTIVGDGTNTERSDFYTPPTTPLGTASPDSPEPEGATRPLSQLNGDVHRKSDSGVSNIVPGQIKGFNNGSIPSIIQHHVQEVVPLIKVAESKTTVVNIGSERALWRQKSISSSHHLPGAHNPELVLHSLSVSKKDLARPLYRKDIFYSGSVLNIPQYQSQPDMKSYITSITTIPGEVAYFEGECWAWRYVCVPQSCKDTLQEMMDFSLLKDFGFMLICFGNIMAFLGFYVPFVYVVDFAVGHGIDKGRAAFLISVIGITNTVGRVVTGWLADMRKINSLVITYVSIFLCGVSTAIFPFCTTFEALCAVCCFFGLTVAAFISLSSILICDLMGLEKLTNGFGLMTMFRGVAAMAGPPLAGFVYDQTSSYDASFYLGGALLVVGALCHLALYLPCAKQKQSEQVISEYGEELPTFDRKESAMLPEIVAIEEIPTSV